MTNDINARQAGMKESRMEEEYHCFGCFRFYCDIMGKDIGRLRPFTCFSGILDGKHERLELGTVYSSSASKVDEYYDCSKRTCTRFSVWS